MGTYSKGILGPFSGKIGTVVGSSWKGVDYMRSLPKKSNKQPTDAQLEQRMRMMIAINFLKPVTDLLATGFKNVSGNSSGYNVAVSRLVKNGLTGIYPDIDLDYSKVLISEGSLTQPAVPALESVEPGKVNLTWRDNSDNGLAKPGDKAFLLAYVERLARYSFNTKGADRSTGLHVVDLEDFSGEEVHLWMAFISADGKKLSTSIYAGSVVVL